MATTNPYILYADSGPKSHETFSNLGRGKATSRMSRHRCQCSMEFGIEHNFGLAERIEYPQYAVRLDLTILCQFSQPGVASEQGPLARFRNRKCKRVWR